MPVNLNFRQGKPFGEPAGRLEFPERPRAFILGISESPEIHENQGGRFFRIHV